MKKELKIFYAEIAWAYSPWQTVNIGMRDGERYISSSDKTFHLVGLTDNPANNTPGFWQDVRQWGFAFEDDDSDKVRGYYRLYGRLAVTLHGKQRKYKESWEVNKEALGWFNLLTSLLANLKDRKLGPLWEYFSNPRIQVENGIWFYPEDSRKKGSGSAPPFHDFPFYSICSLEPAIPQDDEQLLKATWRVIAGEVEKMLNEIRLSPITIDELDSRSLTWRFHARGAFEAAFLQWYFQELAGFKVEICQKFGCENTVPPDRKKYCGPKCYASAAKQRQRVKKREAKKHG